jgi:hypothetical protein
VGTLALIPSASEKFVAELLGKGLRKLAERNGASALLGAQIEPLPLATHKDFRIKPFQSMGSQDDLGVIEEFIKESGPLPELMRQGAQPLGYFPGNGQAELLWSWFL